MCGGSLRAAQLNVRSSRAASLFLPENVPEATRVERLGQAACPTRSFDVTSRVRRPDSVASTLGRLPKAVLLWGLRRTLMPPRNGHETFLVPRTF